MIKTTIYLIRHSVRFNNKNILQYNTNQNNIIKNEKIVLSSEGEKRAEILSNEDELQNIDVVYTSNCVRTLQTAKYLLEKQNLKVTIDERFDERRLGKTNNNIVKDWWLQQYIDENYKTEGGESQKEVRERFTEAFNEILDIHKGKRIAIFSHGYAITFFIMNWCKFEYNGEKDDMKFLFENKKIFDKKINAPEVFKLEFDEKNKIIDIQNIEFEDLPYKDGLGN
ncbi:MAG: histidine phosphatase family protein [Clostridia bacterium]|nr:histidine phosphatase family protein [Clostridia bacterium]